MSEAERNGSVAVTLHVPGLHGRHLVRLVTARLRDLPGAELVQADGTTGLVVVQGPVTVEALRQAITDLGFPDFRSPVSRSPDEPGPS